MDKDISFFLFLFRHSCESDMKGYMKVRLHSLKLNVKRRRRNLIFKKYGGKGGGLNQNIINFTTIDRSIDMN